MTSNHNHPASPQPGGRWTHAPRLLWALALAAQMTVGQAQIVEKFTLSGLNQDLPDGNPVGMSCITNLASGITSIGSVKVRLNLAGEFNGDLYGYLRHSNQIVILLNRPGRASSDPFGYDDSGVNVTFDDNAPGDIHLYRSLTNLPFGSPLTGSWQPDGRYADPNVVTDTTPRTTTLAAFRNMNASGPWTLYLADMESGGTNQLVSWELEFTGGATPAVTWPAPADIVYGTALSGSQLNATAAYNGTNLPGTMAYTPAAGTILDAGANRILKSVFTPADTNSFPSVTTSVALTVSMAPLTVTPAAASRAYGDANPVLSGSISGVKNGDSLSASYSSTASAFSSVGAYPITAAPSGARLTNYAVTLMPASLTVTSAPLTVAAWSTNRAYGAANPVFAGTLSGIKNSDPITASYSSTASAASPVGAYAITASASGAALSNYALTLVPGTLSVSAAPLTVAALSTNRVYGAANPVFTGILSGVKNGDPITASYSSTASAASPVGGYAITAAPSGALLSNYAVTLVPGTLTVSAAALTVTANSTNRVYGSANPAFSGTISGIKNSDPITASYSTTASAASPAGAYNIVPAAAGALLSNYTVSAVNGTLTIGRASSTALVQSSSNPARPGQTVTLVVGLTAVAPSAGIPSGVVQFKIDGAAAGSPVALASGAAAYSVSTLAHGAHTVVAEYAGDANFTGATNTLAASQIINTPPVAAAHSLERSGAQGVKARLTTLLAGDSDADGDALTATLAAASAAGGTVVVSHGWVYYTPAAGSTNADSFTYSLADTYGATVTGTVSVTIKADVTESRNLSIEATGDGGMRLVFSGIPNRTYTIQYTQDLRGGNWVSLGAATADSLGIYEYTDRPANGSPIRIYRSACLP